MPTHPAHTVDGERPFVRMNMALSADGSIATPDRTESSFGSALDQAHLYSLRAKADAIICGAETIRRSTVLLDAGPVNMRQQRLRHGLEEYPLRIVASQSGQVAPNTAILQPYPAPLLILTPRSTPMSNLTEFKQAGAHIAKFGSRSINFKHALSWLWKAWKVRNLLVEGGGRLNASLLSAGLVDEIHLTFCPLVLGGNSAPTLADGCDFIPLAKALKLKLLSLQRRGAEAFAIYSVIRTTSPSKPQPDEPSTKAGRKSG